MIPTWTLPLSFVVGLLVGAAGGMVIGRRSRSGARLSVPESTEGGSVAAAQPAVDEPAPAPEPDTAILAAGAQDVTAELERRYRGRRVAAESERHEPGA